MNEMTDTNEFLKIPNEGGFSEDDLCTVCDILDNIQDYLDYIRSLCINNKLKYPSFQMDHYIYGIHKLLANMLQEKTHIDISNIFEDLIFKEISNLKYKVPYRMYKDLEPLLQTSRNNSNITKSEKVNDSNSVIALFNSYVTYRLNNNLQSDAYSIYGEICQHIIAKNRNEGKLLKLLGFDKINKNIYNQSDCNKYECTFEFEKEKGKYIWCPESTNEQKDYDVLMFSDFVEYLNSINEPLTDNDELSKQLQDHDTNRIDIVNKIINSVQTGNVLSYKNRKVDDNNMSIIMDTSLNSSFETNLSNCINYDNSVHSVSNNNPTSANNFYDNNSNMNNNNINNLNEPICNSTTLDPSHNINNIFSTPYIYNNNSQTNQIYNQYNHQTVQTKLYDSQESTQINSFKYHQPYISNPASSNNSFFLQSQNKGFLFNPNSSLQNLQINHIDENIYNNKRLFYDNMQTNFLFTPSKNKELSETSISSINLSNINMNYDKTNSQINLSDSNQQDYNSMRINDNDSNME